MYVVEKHQTYSPKAAGSAFAATLTLPVINTLTNTIYSRVMYGSEISAAALTLGSVPWGRTTVIVHGAICVGALIGTVTKLCRMQKIDLLEERESQFGTLAGGIAAQAQIIMYRIHNPTAFAVDRKSLAKAIFSGAIISGATAFALAKIWKRSTMDP